MQDFKAHLHEQLDFLRTSIAGYDAGREHEAKRLSVPIRTLVHNTRRSTSLLTHLGVQHLLGWIDRGPPNPPPRGHVISFGLCVVQMRFDTGESRYQPAIHHPAPDRLHPLVSFEDWWRRPVLHDQRGNEFSRADLVLAMANQDGGAHIDAALDEKYRALTRENSLGFSQDGERPLANSVVTASVRHIAGELLETVERGLAWDDDDPVVHSPLCRLQLGAVVRAGRNEPCPCGSGKKLKHCYGRRQPLHVMVKPPEDSQAGRAHPLPGATPHPNPPDAPPSMEIDCLLLVPVDEQRHQRAALMLR